ncbi:MAG: sensor histidine kinase [Bacteroidetes bacterium]|nr:sensor histidine kinase [Bacteroidota bacterium]
MFILCRTCKTTAAVITFILMAVPLHSQYHLSRAQFDSLYDKAMGGLTADTVTSLKYLETLKASGEALSDLQRARLAYLQMKINDAAAAHKPERGNSAFAGQGHLTIPDSLQFYARRYLERSMPDMAIPLLMKALQILPVNSGDADHARIELCEAYREKQEYRKGISLIENLLERQATVSDFNRAYAFNRLAALYNEWGNPAGSYRDSVIKYSLLCRELSEKTGDKPSLAAAQNELSFQYTRTKEYHRALELSQQAVSNFLSSAMPFQAMNVLLNQSHIYQGQKEYRLALGALREATRLAPLWENRNLYMRIYYRYASIYKATGDYREAYGFLSLCLGLQSEFYGDRINNQIVEQSARYDLFVKEQTIRNEQKKNEYNHRQIILLIILSAALALAFAASFFYFRLSRKGAIRQKLIAAVLETETSERMRIARDLHDGLGPLLSAINHYFQAFLDAKPGSREAIRERLQTVISESIDEVSRISHSISPHVLERHGLMTALNNLMAPLTANGKYEVNFNSDLEQRLAPETELNVYRCITELISNTMKHAEASRITLDIRHTGNQLLILYSDNGKGFGTASGKTAGMGLHNIRNRVESSGGTLSMESSPAAGILVSITLPV